MSKNMEGVRNKSYTLPGINGGELTLGETINRQSIKVVAKDSDNRIISLLITKEQLEALCATNSVYDGLECRPSPPSEEGAVIITPAPAHQPETDEEQQL